MRSLRLRVKPNAKARIIRTKPVRLPKSPIDGTNAELIALLVQQINVTNDIRIKSGSSSKYKLVKIDD